MKIWTIDVFTKSEKLKFSSAILYHGSLTACIVLHVRAGTRKKMHVLVITVIMSPCMSGTCYASVVCVVAIIFLILQGS